MTINRNLSNLAPGASSTGVLDVTKGGTGVATPGTSGNVLTSNGTAWTSAAPGTASSATNLAGGTAGVVPFQSGSGATSFTAAGTSGQVLTSAGTGTPTWTTPSAGAMTLISTQTANNTSQYLTFTGITGYSSYMLILNNIRVATGGSNPYLYFGTGSTPTWQTSSYDWVLNISYNATNPLNNSTNGAGIILGFNGYVSTASLGMVGQVLIGNLASSSMSKAVLGQVSFYNNGNYWTNLSVTGQWNDTTPVTALRIDFSTTVTSGSVSLYGISG